MILAETALNCLFIIIAAFAVVLLIGTAYLAIAEAWRHMLHWLRRAGRSSDAAP